MTIRRHCTNYISIVTLQSLRRGPFFWTQFFAISEAHNYRSHQTFGQAWAYEETFAEKGTLEKEQKIRNMGNMFRYGVEVLSVFGFGRTLGWPHYTWDKVNLGFGQFALGYRWMRTGVPQMLLGREMFFFESFFRLIFEFLTNSVLQCSVKKGGPLNLWVNALVLKDERVPEFLTYRSIGSSSLPPSPKEQKIRNMGNMFRYGVEVLSVFGFGRTLGWPHYTWDKVNLGFGQVALGYRWMRTGVPQMLLGREMFFFESFFRLIFEFLTNSVLQCSVKKGGPLNLYIYIYIHTI